MSKIDSIPYIVVSITVVLIIVYLFLVPATPQVINVRIVP